MNSAAGALTGGPMKKVMEALGVAATKDAEAPVRRDLGGDLRFSGWPRAGNLRMGFAHTGPGEIELRPAPRGAWKVAESGRRSGRRGRTAGKRTFTDATKITAAKSAKRAEPLIVDVLREEIGV